jgi:hypothetical protein
MAGLANRIVRHNVEDQILHAVIDQLVWFAGFEDESVASFDGCLTLGVPDQALS